MQTAQKFSMNGALQFGWKTMKHHFWFFIHMFIITILFEMIFIILAEIFAPYIPDSEEERLALQQGSTL